MMTKRMFLALCATAAIILSAAAFVCSGQNPFVPEEPEKSDESESAPEPSYNDDGEFVLKDPDTLYDYDINEVSCLYVTVVEGDESQGTNHSFEEVNSYHNLPGEYVFEHILANAIVRSGDENGNLDGQIAYSGDSANATINVRGRTSTGYDQKSYKIEFLEDGGVWNGQKTIALNKHPADYTRVKNSVYFYLLRDIPGLTSLRTYFVHLFVRDATSSGDGNMEYEDFGLYTAVEQPNKRYLKARGFDKKGALYKANMCEMYRYEDSIRLVTDPLYDSEEFEKVFEPKTTDDHSKLIRMLDAVNDESIPIDEIVDKYFDVDNLMSYVAYNLLMDNPDSDAQNYYLYSPSDSSRWYYICWDGDGCLSTYEYEATDYQYAEGGWTKGISNYWGVVLFNRMFREEKYRDMLTERVEEIHKIISAERIKDTINMFRKTVDPFTDVSPDAEGMGIDPEVRAAILNNMAYDTNIAYRNYYESLKKPMPFYLGGMQRTDDGLYFEWDDAYSFDNSKITYDIFISNDPSFDENSIVYTAETGDTKLSYDIIDPGTYYYRVVAKNSRGKTQMAFDQIDAGYASYDGMRMFTVESDGTVVTEYE